MIEENLARLRAYRNNIRRYKRLLATQLSDLERAFIAKRLEEEQAEAGRHARDGGDGRLDGGDHRDLSRRGADQAYRGEPLLPPRGRQPFAGT